MRRLLNMIIGDRSQCGECRMLIISTISGLWYVGAHKWTNVRLPVDELLRYYCA